MNKQRGFLGIVLIIILGVFLFSISQKDLITLNIINSTKTEINSLELRYNDKQIKSINIMPEEKMEISVDSSIIKTEGALSLFYKDKNNKTQRIVLIGYISPGEKTSATVEITDIDENGVIKTKSIH